ncbi:MAG: RsmE family RNA methyltransferase [Candidatus Omnitrophota bacterium]
MGRFFVAKESVYDGEAVISGDEARHMIEVMRLENGDNVVVFDGEGSEYRGTVKNADRKKMTLTVSINDVKNFPPEEFPRITLAQAIPKKNKMDLIVEKATELGVHRIVPIITERTIVRPDKRNSSKVTERWKRIALETSKQCGRQRTPEISGTVFFREVIGTVKNYDLSLLACLDTRTVPIKRALPSPVPKNVLVIIGPEGDFSPPEIENAEEERCILVSLGKRVLKSDTAGLFVISIIGYEGGDC